MTKSLQNHVVINVVDFNGVFWYVRGENIHGMQAMSGDIRRLN